MYPNASVAEFDVPRMTCSTRRAESGEGGRTIYIFIDSRLLTVFGASSRLHIVSFRLFSTKCDPQGVPFIRSVGAIFKVRFLL